MKVEISFAVSLLLIPPVIFAAVKTGAAGFRMNGC